MRRRAERLGDNADFVPDGCGEEVLIGFAIVVGVVVLVLFGWPVVVLLVDLVWLVVVLLLGVVARVVFRRPWRVEADSAEGMRQSWSVVGFRAAGRRRDEVAEALAAGLEPTAAAAAPHSDQT